MANPSAEARPEVPLKRQWDAELEAEMEAALTGFDPKTFEVAGKGRRPPTEPRGPGATGARRPAKGRASARSSASAAGACSSIWAEKAKA